MFIIYSKPGCAFCEHAKSYLAAKNLPYQELILDVGQAKLEERSYYSLEHLKNKIPGVKTVPQIFEDHELIGGYEALKKHVEAR